MRSQAADVDPTRMLAPAIDKPEGDAIELDGQNERLLRAAEPVIGSLSDELGPCGYGIILTDARGNVLRLYGGRDIKMRLEKIELRPGGRWNEASTGTNAIGTAIADRRPIQMMAAEHFCDGWQGLMCTAAPVHAPETGDIIGVLDITSPYYLIRSRLLAHVMQCALEIEEALSLTQPAIPR